MKEFVLFVIRHLVNDPAAVEVKETRGDTASVIELKVAKEDLGRVIGKGGHTVAALRTILHAVASRMQRRVVLQIVESDENSQPSVHLSVRVPRAGGGGYVCAGGLCDRVRVIHHEEGGPRNGDDNVTTGHSGVIVLPGTPARYERRALQCGQEANFVVAIVPPLLRHDPLRRQGSQRAVRDGAPRFLGSGAR